MKRNLLVFAALLALWLPGGRTTAGESALGSSSQDSNVAEVSEESTKADVRAEDAEKETVRGESETSAGSGRRTIRHRDALVVFSRDVELKADETAEAVVVIGGSARIYGRVNAAVVAVGGDVLVDGEVHDAVVAVMGNVNAGPKAKINGEVVSVGGKVETEEGASISGGIHEVEGIVPPHWLRNWFRHSVLMLRPMAPQVGWLWGVAAAFLLLYALIAALFPRPVLACVEELNRRPATTFLLGILTNLLVPVVLLLLGITGVGLIVVPFLLAALFLGAIVGKVALLEWIGFRIGRQFAAEALQRPMLALLVGGFIILLLYMIPVFGLIMLFATALWGLGAAVGAAFGGLRRELPERPPAGPAPAPLMPVSSPGPGPSTTTFAVNTGAEPSPANPPATQPTAGATPPPAAAAAALPMLGEPPVMVPDALAYPKASFWERMGAAFLDVVLVSILSVAVGGLPLGLLVMLAYFAGMWAWKGTTIGGIVLGIKVARLDGGPVTFAVALVRGLAAALSAIVLFLGFIAIAWDKDKQGWHDKIAGTVVVKLPRGMPLVCL